MRRSMVAVFAVVALAACQSAPRPTEIARASSIATPSAMPTPTPTPQPTSPFKSDAYEPSDILVALETFGTALVELYDRPPEGAIDRLFTPEGKTNALEYDWRLRSADRAETWFRGEVSVRGWTTTDERPLDAPPTLKANIAFLVAPGAELIDARTGAVLESWSQRQDFAMEVVLQYQVDADVWRASSLGPPFEWPDDPPGIPAPPVKCPGLSKDRPDDADLVRGRRWCFGGRDGTRATKEQVIVFDRYPCGTSRASILTVGWPVGAQIDHLDAHQFVRDPDGLFDRQWPLPSAYLANTRLPKDAYSTGLTEGEFEIWVSPAADAKAIWVQHGRKVERWPRAPKEWGVIDCN